MKGQRGFMTVELIITMVVGSLLILSLNDIMTTHTFLSQRGRDLAVANSFAEQQAEGLRSKGFLALTIGTTDLTAQLPVELSRPRSSSVEISSRSPGVKQVRIAISYNEQGKQRNMSYLTYVGELGVGQ